MKIIKDYKDLGKGDIVALSYTDEGNTCNVVGEIREVEDVGIYVNIGSEFYYYGIGGYDYLIKTVMLLCSASEKLELGSVWVNKADDFKLVVGEWAFGNKWRTYYESGKSMGNWSKEDTIERCLTLQDETTPEEMTVSEISKELGREILIKKE